MTRTIAGLDIAHRIEQKIPGAVEGAIPEAATVKADKLAEVCTFLRDDPELKLAHDRAQPLRALGWFDTAELLDCDYIRQVACHRGKIVCPVRERDVLCIRTLLGQLFHRAVQVPHHHVRIDNLLSVERQPETEDAMRARVLGPKVYDEWLGLNGQG